jgi:hypothetical protein
MLHHARMARQWSIEPIHSTTRCQPDTDANIHPRDSRQQRGGVPRPCHRRRPASHPEEVRARAQLVDEGRVAGLSEQVLEPPATPHTAQGDEVDVSVNGERAQLGDEGHVAGSSGQVLERAWFATSPGSWLYWLRNEVRAWDCASTELAIVGWPKKSAQQPLFVERA